MSLLDDDLDSSSTTICSNSIASASIFAISSLSSDSMSSSVRSLTSSLTLEDVVVGSTLGVGGVALPLNFLFAGLGVGSFISPLLNSLSFAITSASCPTYLFIVPYILSPTLSGAFLLLCKSSILSSVTSIASLALTTLLPSFLVSID